MHHRVALDDDARSGKAPRHVKPVGAKRQRGESLSGGEAAVEACRVLRGAEGYLKTELAHTMKVRKIPALEFIPDDSVDYYNRIDSILKGLSHDEGTDSPADGEPADGNGSDTDPDA